MMWTAARAAIGIRAVKENIRVRAKGRKMRAYRRTSLVTAIGEITHRGNDTNLIAKYDAPVDERASESCSNGRHRWRSRVVKEVDVACEGLKRGCAAWGGTSKRECNESERRRRIPNDELVNEREAALTWERSYALAKTVRSTDSRADCAMHMRRDTKMKGKRVRWRSLRNRRISNGEEKEGARNEKTKGQRTKKEKREEGDAKKDVNGIAKSLQRRHTPLQSATSLTRCKRPRGKDRRAAETADERGRGKSQVESRRQECAGNGRPEWRGAGWRREYRALMWIGSERGRAWGGFCGATDGGWQRDGSDHLMRTNGARIYRLRDGRSGSELTRMRGRGHRWRESGMECSGELFALRLTPSGSANAILMPSQKLVAPQRLHLNHRRCRSGQQTHLRLSQEEIEAEGTLMEALRHAEADAVAEEDARLDDGAVEIHSEDKYLG
ncbi:hypothetical protein B0H10DRAFT_1954990 [Mycena sp. CBHHK59/15]|nr:hypothetical protein B0H10DRAFT_1954990 [Mycena sp. CBHHK59/15]